MKYQVTKHWINGMPIEQYDFDILQELYEIPMIKEQMSKGNFRKLGWQSWYCMPSGMPHYSSWDIMVEFVDGSSERICDISLVSGTLDINDMHKLGLGEIPQVKYKSLITIPKLFNS